MDHRSKICSPHCDVFWATGTSLQKKKPLNISYCSYAKYSFFFFLLVPFFKCSCLWFYLSSNAVSRALICLQIQFFMLLYFQMWLLMVVPSNVIVNGSISSNVVVNGSIRLQMWLLMVVCLQMWLLMVVLQMWLLMVVYSNVVVNGSVFKCGC